MAKTPLIETFNLNIWSKCNLRCAYCYGDFPERRWLEPRLSVEGEGVAPNQ